MLVFGVWLERIPEGSDSNQCSTPSTLLTDAMPKHISGRTSYYRARLEFLRYPQLIPAFCTMRGFGPPQVFTLASPWPWIGRPVSGLVLATLRSPVKARFHSGSIPKDLTGDKHKLVGSFFNRNAVTHKGLRLIVSIWFQILFHSPLGVLFSFPSRYSSLSIKTCI